MPTEKKRIHINCGPELEVVLVNARDAKNVPGRKTDVNEEHRHSGIGFLTPASVHSRTALAIVARREETLAAAFAAHPERFKGKTSRVRPITA
jgi:hypothetical protein